ncbi:hypothetical protein LJB42_002776 [Komagataella kurtzmanii]|nr:hypothetical protein LJB42_002776 [Komagataella kurtzmanii]
MGRKVANNDPNVDSFLRKVQELDAKKKKEDSERVLKLEEEVESKRSKVGDLDELKRSKSKSNGPPQRPQKPDSLKSGSEEEYNDIQLIHPIARDEEKQNMDSEEEAAPQLPKRPKNSILEFPEKNSFVDSLPNFNNSKAPKVIRSEDVLRKPKRDFVINKGNRIGREKVTHDDEKDENPPALPLRRSNVTINEGTKEKPNAALKLGTQKDTKTKENAETERKPLIPSKPTSLKVLKPETTVSLKTSTPPPPAPKPRNQKKDAIIEENNDDSVVESLKKLSPKPKTPAKPSSLQVPSKPITTKPAPFKPTKPKDLAKGLDSNPPEAVVKAKEIKSKPLILPKKVSKSNFNQPQEDILQSQLQKLRESKSSGKNHNFNAAQETILNAQLNGLRSRKPDQNQSKGLLPKRSETFSSKPVPIPFMVDPSSSRELEISLTESRTIDGSDVGLPQEHHQSLSHPNMTRAKGPKRRLPKTLSNPEAIKQPQSTSSTASLGKKVPPPKPSKKRIVSNSELFL